MTSSAAEFITFAGGVAAGWPLAVRAQQQPMPAIGFLHPGSPQQAARYVAAFAQGLKDSGYVERQNVAIEYRWAEGQYDRLPTLAAELVRRQVSVIAATGGTFSGLAAKGATAEIPIVNIGTGDPVSLGLVASLNRPGGNVTGVTMLAIELLPKRLELLRELMPNIRKIGVLVNPTNPTAKVQLREVGDAASTLGQEIVKCEARSESDFEDAFANLVHQQAGSVLITSDTFLNNQHDQLAALTVRYAMPAISEVREFAVAGGLMSYGASFADGYRQAGIYTGRILKGEKPADLPVMQSTKFEFVINLKTAKTLGINVPTNVLALATEVIE